MEFFLFLIIGYFCALYVFQKLFDLEPGAAVRGLAYTIGILFLLIIGYMALKITEVPSIKVSSFRPIIPEEEELMVGAPECQGPFPSSECQ